MYVHLSHVYSEIRIRFRRPSSNKSVHPPLQSIPATRLYFTRMMCGLDVEEPGGARPPTAPRTHTRAESGGGGGGAAGSSR